LLQSPAAAYAFWASSIETYRSAKPHEGYEILERICASKSSQCTCVYTSNVDGHFRRFETLSRRLYEIHGCVEEWACGSSMGYVQDEVTGRVRSRGGAFAEHNAAMEQTVRSQIGPDKRDNACDGRNKPWPATCARWVTFPPRDDMTMRTWITRCRRETDAESVTHLDEADKIEPLTSAAPQNAVSASGGVDWGASITPKCPHCQSALRPRVVMFGDTDEELLSAKAAEAEEYQAWEAAMEMALVADVSSSLVVLEIGCGERVPSVRDECEAVVRDTLRQGGRALLVRINPEAQCLGLPQDSHPSEGVDEEEPDPLVGHVVTLRSGAAQALAMVEAELGRLQAVRH
jgi:NAD-dependent SIR2 family protein deacetylase